jgi:hypothetical protein
VRWWRGREAKLYKRLYGGKNTAWFMGSISAPMAMSLSMRPSLP